MASKIFLICAGFFGCIGIIFGALAAHILKSMLSLPQLDIFNLGITYQMYHALALLAIAIWLRFYPSRLLTIAATLFCLGILLFSGSLYCITYFNLPSSGIAPIGGLAFIIGWLMLIIAGFKLKATQ